METRGGLTFEAPGPGSWSFARAHQTAPFPRLVIPIWEARYPAGFRRGFREIGALLDTLEVRFVHGWIYIRPRPVGAPEKATKPPPAFIFKLLVRVHPELRRRLARAEEAWSTRPWRTANARWRDELSPAFRARLSELQATSVDALVTNAAVLAHLRDVFALYGDVVEENFAIASQSVPALGEIFVRAEALGIAPHEAMQALTGASPETTRPREHGLAIARAAREQGLDSLLDGTRTDAGVLALLRANAKVAAAIDAFLAEYGWRASDLTPLSPTLAEEPERIVAAVRAALARPASLAKVDDLSSRIPEADRAEWRAVVEEAREAGMWREERVAFGLWACGLVRRAVLELARRFGDRIPEPEAAFDCSLEELTSLAEGKGPSRDELAMRIAQRRAAENATPPHHFGPVSSPPPAEWLPRGRRLAQAVDAFVRRFDAEGDEMPSRPSGAALAGHGVSPGIVEGIARVVRSASDLNRVAPGDIVVAPATSVGFNATLALASGLVTDHGGLVCHAAIVTRELGIPGIVGCGDATRRVPDGARIRIDGGTGTIMIVDAAPAAVAPRAAAPTHATSTVTPQKPERPGACVPLADASDAARFGGKGASLARAIRAGLPVPGGIALDTGFVEAIAAECTEHRARLEGAIRTLDVPFAVRSSAIGEDEADASFAGIHETVLGVDRDRMFDAVASVWRSAHSDLALAYRRRRNIRGVPKMGVVAQTIIAAEVAGVFFGRDPVTGEDVRVLEGAWGLGVVVVDGRVTPDRVRLDPNGSILARDVGDKPVRVTLDGEEKNVERRRASCLDDALVREIFALGRECDRLFGSPQDIEWAFAGGRLWLLQSRPITTLRNDLTKPQCREVGHTP